MMKNLNILLKIMKIINPKIFKNHNYLKIFWQQINNRIIKIWLEIVAIHYKKRIIMDKPKKFKI